MDTQRPVFLVKRPGPTKTLLVHTHHSLGQHSPAQHTEDTTAVHHSATRDNVLDSVNLLLTAANAAVDVERLVTTSDHNVVTALTDTAGYVVQEQLGASTNEDNVSTAAC